MAERLYKLTESGWGELRPKITDNYGRQWTQENIKYKTGQDSDTIRKILNGEGVTNSSINKMLRQFGIQVSPQYIEVAPSAPKYKTEHLTVYLEYIVSTCENIHPSGFVIGGMPIESLPLEEAYVALKASSYSKSRSEDITLDQVVKGLRRAVIEGKPGAGKSTCMQFLALHFAKAMLTSPEDKLVRDKNGLDYGRLGLPILVRIKDYEKAEEGLSIREYLPRTCKELTNRIDFRALFEEALETGNALVMLDGMDEVGDVGKHRQIMQQITKFGNAIISKGNRLLVTTRSASYSRGVLGAGFLEYTLKPMEELQIRSFLVNWHSSLLKSVYREAAEQTKTLEAQTQLEAQAQSDSLWQQIKDQPGLLRIADTPLLLTILATVNYNDKKLPERRVDVYEIAVESLLAEWRIAQTGLGEKKIRKDERKILIEPLAYHMHEQSNTGEIDAEQFGQKCRELKKPFNNLQTDEVINYVDDFEYRVKKHSGILQEVRPGTYAFSHLTFQEYLAGCFMVSDSDMMYDLIQKHVDNPYWREPILLAIAKKTTEDATNLLVRGVLGQDTKLPPEQWAPITFDHLVLACYCLADHGKIQTNVQEELAKRLVHTYLQIDIFDVYNYQKSLETAIPVVSLTECGAKASALLLEQLPELNYFKFNNAFKVLLGVTDLHNEKTLKYLLDSLAHKNQIVQEAVAWQLGIAARENAQILAKLEALDDALRMKVAALTLVCPLQPVEPQITPHKGMEFLTIPAGGYWQGEMEDEDAILPPWNYLGEYKISKYPVTVAQFRVFTNKAMMEFDWNAYEPDWGWIDDHPMVRVTRNEARAYCKWAGGDLPTKKQWGKAARGTDGREFPWGDVWNPRKQNFYFIHIDSFEATISVGSSQNGVSQYGVHDMAVNVREWCRDYHEEFCYHYALNYPAKLKQPIHRTASGGYVLTSSFDRGYDEYHEACRRFKSERYNNTGFRVVLNCDSADFIDYDDYVCEIVLQQ